jgi:hypothetical protein
MILNNKEIGVSEQLSPSWHAKVNSVFSKKYVRK